MSARVRIKICGVRDAESARVAAEAGADAVGLVFVAGSPRCVTVAEARTVVGALPAFVEPVGLFVDTPVERVRETAGVLGLRTVQLHGDETPEEAAALAPLRVVKAIGFRAGTFARQVEDWARGPGNVAAVLVDVAVDRGVGTGELPGGTGQAVDWGALGRALDAVGRETLPAVVLAGGLTPGNVAAAIAAVRPYGVDVSSGVESSRGVKDGGLIRAFCRAARGGVTADGEVPPGF